MEWHEKVIVFGVTIDFWVGAFLSCHRFDQYGITRVEWPDGEPYLEQPNIVIEMFGLIEKQAIEVMKKNGK